MRPSITRHQPHFLTLSLYSLCLSLYMAMPPIIHHPLPSPCTHTRHSLWFSNLSASTCRDTECTTIYYIFSQKEFHRKSPTEWDMPESWWGRMWSLREPPGSSYLSPSPSPGDFPLTENSYVRQMRHPHILPMWNRGSIVPSGFLLP